MASQEIDWIRVASSACLGGGAAAMFGAMFMDGVKRRGPYLMFGGCLFALGFVLRLF